MSDLFSSLAGHRTTAIRVTVPNVGVWTADVDLDEQLELAGAVELQIGALVLKGTIDPTTSGTFGLKTKVRVVGGGGGWRKQLPAKPYHNDARIKASTIAADAAREAGEVLGDFAPPAERVGVDYERKAGAASHALEDVLDGVPWWVDYQGVTHAGRRTPTPAGAYELLSFDPRHKYATLHLDDLTTVGIGSVLSARLDAPQTVRELDIIITEDSLRVLAWCGGSDDVEGNLAASLLAIARKAQGGRLFGKYRYRVVSEAGDGRLHLQAVSKAEGLPDMLPITEAPGFVGHVSPTPGTIAYVEFIAGDPTDPRVSAFDDDSTGQPVARVGDTVNVFFPPTIPFVGTVGGSPAAGTLTIAGSSVGIIQSGSSKVKVPT